MKFKFKRQRSKFFVINKTQVLLLFTYVWYWYDFSIKCCFLHFNLFLKKNLDQFILFGTNHFVKEMAVYLHWFFVKQKIFVYITMISYLCITRSLISNNFILVNQSQWTFKQIKKKTRQLHTVQTWVTEQNSPVILFIKMLDFFGLYLLQQ